MLPREDTQYTACEPLASIIYLASEEQCEVIHCFDDDIIEGGEQLTQVTRNATI